MGGTGPKGASQYAQHIHYQMKDSAGQRMNPEKYWDNQGESSKEGDQETAPPEDRVQENNGKSQSKETPKKDPEKDNGKADSSTSKFGVSGTNVLINNRTAVHAGSQGRLTTVDVCLTKIGKKTVPIPYTNIARSADAAQTASTVFINGQPVCHQKSIFAVSTGDEPGDRLGVRSGTIKGKAEFVTSSPTVLIEGIPAVRQGDLMVSNNGNTAPMPLSQPGAPRGRTVTTEQAEELQATQLPRDVSLEASGGKLHIQNELAANSAAVHEVDPDDLEGADNGENHAAVHLNNQDEIYLFNTQKPIAGLKDDDLEQRDFREVVLGAKEEDEKQDLWLKLLDLDPELPGKKGQQNWINLYLGRSKTFERGKSPKKHNVIVPIIPRCYATADRDPAKAVEVPEGWLYIVRQFDSPQGPVVELWRELKSDGLGNFSDVNLKRFKEKDQRRATGQPGFRIIVPYCIGRQDHQVWMAYSEVQWSWNRVQSMKRDSKLRDQRMHKLDLSDCLNEFAGSHYTASPPQKTTSGPALLYNLKSAPDPESQSLGKDFKEAIPVVYLDNPIGIGRRIAGEYQQHWQELTDCVNKLRAIPDYLKPKDEQPDHIKNSASIDPEIQTMLTGPERLFEAAALANRYFYSKISKVIPPGVKDIPAYEKRLAEIDEQFLKYQNNLDKQAIEQALRTSQRRAIREKLVQAREKLVDFLEKELAAIESNESEGGKQDPPLVLALDDYFTLTPLGDQERKQNPTDTVGDKSTPRWRDNYLDGWGAVYDLVAYLGKHEYSIDADLEDRPPDGWDWRRNNPAFELLRKLADSEGGYPLHNRLFPKPAAGDPLKIDAAKVEDNAIEFKIQHLGNLEPLIRRDADIARGLALFGSNFNELMAMRDKNDPAYEEGLNRAQKSILRLIESASPLEFEETERSLAELIAEAEEQLEETKNGGITATKTFLKLAGFTKKTIDTADKDPTFGQPYRDELRNLRVKIIRVADTRRIQRLLHDLSDPKFVSSGLGGFFGLVAIYNFNEALKAFSSNRNKDRNWEFFAPLAARFLKIPSAIKSVKDAALAVEKTVTGGKSDVVQSVLKQKGTIRAAPKTATYEIAEKAIKKLNLIGDLIDMGLTLSSFTENLAQNDDAAIADAIGFTGAALGLFGAVASIPVLGWVAGLVGLAAWLAKALLFKEDTPVEIWINNSPFARGDEYHDQFLYSRHTTIKKVKDSKGKWVNTACTVHRYDGFEFLVDSEGTLVHAGAYQYQAHVSPCKVAPNGEVFLKARKSYSLHENKWYEIPAHTHVATVGQPFSMHPMLQPTVKTDPKPATPSPFKKRQPADCQQNITNLQVALTGAANKGTVADKWRAHPHEAYLALADAVYRPRVTLTEAGSPPEDSRCTLKINLPFYLPGKSELYIEFEEKGDKKGVILMKPYPDGLKIGPGEYELIRQFHFWESRTFTARVRLDLFGDHEVQLPHEPLFCGSDIETKLDEHTNKGVQPPTESSWIVVKQIVGGKRNRGSVEDVIGALIDDIKG